MNKCQGSLNGEVSLSFSLTEPFAAGARRKFWKQGDVAKLLLCGLNDARIGGDFWILLRNPNRRRLPPMRAIEGSLNGQSKRHRVLQSTRVTHDSDIVGPRWSSGSR